MFHQKVGIIEDIEGNKLSFSGSTNESASGWLGNVEEFKVFRNWIQYEKGYFESDEDRFEKFWNDESKRTRIMELPKAVKNKLIKIAPDSVDELNLNKWVKTRKKKNKIKLYDHQKQAISNWLDNGKKGILEMATGTGKTFTALGCLKKLLNRESKLITVIACPYGHLVKQWEDDVRTFGIDSDIIIADSSNNKWKYELSDNIYDIKNGIKDYLIVITTHTTLARQEFIDIINLSNNNLFLIADEVHGLGSEKRQKGLVEKYNFRLGLSATPVRWYDEEGTDRIFDYFGGSVFKFLLKDAINTINPDTGTTYLTPYEYKPYFVELSDEELEEYENLTHKIIKMYNQAKNESEKEELLTVLTNKRQNIIKNASMKYPAFENILDSIYDLKNCLIYCLPDQMEKVQTILNKKDYIHHKFTLHEGTKPDNRYGGISERQFLLNKFAEGTYDCLVAIKCLDEGVDVPPAHTAIILASSGNPREYIQRAGRVLRRYPGKYKSIIYDIIVTPPLSGFINSEHMELERKIMEKELKRYKEFAYSAINRFECLKAIDEIENKYHICVQVGE